MDALVKIVKNEGAFRPVRGMGVVAFGAGPAHALYFSCYEFIKNNFSGAGYKPGDNPRVNFMAGCFATLLHDAVMVPSDVIKQRLQIFNSPYKGLLDCIVKVKREEGIRAFYRSYFTQLSMNIPFQ
jgi:solute carrier family 25 iron transporter 28/37